MESSVTREHASLYETLSDALARADALDLTMVAIHIDEARALIAPSPDVAALLGNADASTGLDVLRK